MPLLDTDRALTRNSYYAATAARESFHPALGEPVSCDVAVVGGGLAGLSAALDLRARGLDVVLLEAHEIGFGASGRNGGQAIHGLACDQDVIEAQLGLDDARRVWKLSIEALDLLQQRQAEHGIDCEWHAGYLGLASSARKAARLQAWADRIEQVYAYPLQRLHSVDMPRWIASQRYHGGIHDPRSGHLNPLKYTLGLARAAAAAGVAVHEHSPVRRLRPGAPAVLETARDNVSADQVLLAGNVHLGAVAPELATRIMPVGTFIGCTEVLDAALADSLIPSRAAVCDSNFVLDYFRTTNDDRLLYGGRVSYSLAAPADLAASMGRRMRATFPQLRDVKVEYGWGGFVDITMNRAPDFGRLAGGAGNIYHLQGFSGHGLALTGLAGRLVADALCGDASRFDVFTRLRHRPFPGGPWLRTPSLVLAMAWYRLRDMLS